MPDPREAVYDVLQAKKERADEEARKRAKRVGDYQSFAEAWSQYEEENARANAAARSPRGIQGATTRLVVIDELSDFQR